MDQLLQQCNNLVLKATHENLAGEDWDTYLEICDLVNRRPDESSKLILSAIKKRLQTNNSKVQLFSLTLVDTCAKNCNDFFIYQLSTQEFLSDIQRYSIQAQDAQVRAKVKELIIDWGKSFGYAHSSFNTAAQQLNQQPQQRPPQPQPQYQPQPVQVQPTQPFAPRSNTQSQPQPQSQPHQHLQSNNIEKIRSDLSVVRENISLLREISSGAQSADELSKNEGGKEIYSTCKEMQKRIVKLIETIPDEGMMMELIAMNDSLNTVIESYENVLRKIKKPIEHKASVPISHPNSTQQPQPQQPQKLPGPTNNQQGKQSIAASNVPQPSIDDIFSAPLIAPPTTGNHQQRIYSQQTQSIDDLLSAPLNNLNLNQNNKPTAPKVIDDFDDEFDALASRKTTSPSSSALAPPLSQQIKKPTPPKVIDDFDNEFDALASRKAASPQPLKPQPQPQNYYLNQSSQNNSIYPNSAYQNPYPIQNQYYQQQSQYQQQPFAPINNLPQQSQPLQQPTQQQRDDFDDFLLAASSSKPFNSQPQQTIYPQPQQYQSQYQPQPQQTIYPQPQPQQRQANQVSTTTQKSLDKISDDFFSL